MSDRTLVLKPSSLPETKNRPWALVLRSHDLSGTDYQVLAYLSDDTALEVVEVSKFGVSWLYGTPDWDERQRKRELERARVLREQAEIIETAGTGR